MTCKLYIGNIPNDTREEELEEKFRKYGRIDSIWLARNPPGFAFVVRRLPFYILYSIFYVLYSI